MLLLAEVKIGPAGCVRARVCGAAMDGEVNFRFSIRKVAAVARDVGTTVTWWCLKS
jgi:hypothetical protein